jgi:hypothetical protein
MVDLPALKKVILEGKPAERKYLFELSPKYFAFYYFTPYFSYPPAPFHDDMWEDYAGLMAYDLDEAAWIMFRESAKTSIAKICVIHAICFKKKAYINWDSYDKSNAEQALFDIALELQTNQRLIADFGHFYNEPLDRSKKSKKRVGDFITNNGVRVSAFSTGTSMRGRVIGKQRPDWLILDDFENEATKESAAVTEGVIRHIDSAKAGLAPTGTILYLGNYISDSGSVDHVLNKLKGEPKAVARNIPVERNGVILWPGKYVFTDEEAVASHVRPEKRKVSLETKRRKLDNYDAEMLNNPFRSEDLFFNRIKVDKALELARDPEEINAGLHIFETFKPSHRYGLGADVAEGSGKDASTTAVIDFDDGVVVATFADNKIAPDRFADEIVREARMYGKCIVAPERNSVGVATVIRLADTYDHIYLDQKAGQIGDPTTKKYGWRTTKESKSTMLYALKKAFEDGSLRIFDRRVLEEMRVYTRSHFQELGRTSTKHSDLLIATCIAHMMRDHAPYPESETDDSVPYIANKGL